MRDPVVQPLWKNVYPELSRLDPTPLVLQRTYLIVTTLALISVVFSIEFCVGVLGIDNSFDEIHLSKLKPGPPRHTQRFQASVFIYEFIHLIRLTTGLSFDALSICASSTFLFYITLILIDVTTSSRPYPWPGSWETNNNICYDEMFAEPSRRDRFIRRPGNTLSNFFYLFLSVVIISSTFSRLFSRSDVESDGSVGFAIADAVFGLMLLILGLASTVWHGCNAMWSHGVDLWSMEAVIFYLPVRLVSLGIMVLLSNLKGNSLNVSFVASTFCLSTYVCHILLNGRRWYTFHKKGLWVDGCPFSVRNRLPNSPWILQGRHDESGIGKSIGNNQNVTSKFSQKEPLKPIYVLEACLFALMPVVNNILPWILMKVAFHSIGSAMCGRVTNLTLVFGWSYRLMERWCLDCCQYLRYFAAKMDVSKKRGEKYVAFTWMTLAAILSPTAVLHFCTGITLLAAYCHVRSLEMSILTSSN